MDPAAPQPDAPVARPLEQLLRHEHADLRQDLGVAGRVQAVAAEVEPVAVPVEAAGVAADGRLLLDQRDGSPPELVEAVGRPGSGGPRAEHEHVGLHAALRTESELSEGAGAPATPCLSAHQNAPARRPPAISTLC